MLTLIVPCAGKSSRFPGMKPKWMLTHPDGKLMIEKSLEGFDVASFDRIIVSIVKPHVEKYDAELVLNQVFLNKKIEICILDDFTESASETIVKTLIQKIVTGPFVVKDSDNQINFKITKEGTNSIVFFDLIKHPDVTNIPGKSFIVPGADKTVGDIVEKRVVSNFICLGVYQFSNAEKFIEAYRELKQQQINGEMFVSNVISYLIRQKGEIFYLNEASNYIDWGTLREWKEEQIRYRTYFVDIDGVLLKNCGRYGKINWENNEEVLKENCKLIKELQDGGAQIVITTSRTEEFREKLTEILHKQGICPVAIVMGLSHAARVVINDFAPTNAYPSCIAISFPRNGNLSDYI